METRTIAVCAGFLLSFAGCAPERRIDNGFLVHENLYRAPILNDPSWVHAIPAGNSDALYVRCPSEQSIVIFYRMLCGKFYYAKMSAEDYPKRLYLDTYFTGFKGFCPAGGGSLKDPGFEQVIGAPDVDAKNRRFSIAYESTRQRLCSSNADAGPIQMKIMDVLIEDRQAYFWGWMHSRFVVFRYSSPVDDFEKGLVEFRDLVSKFEWIKGLNEATANRRD